MNEPQIRPEKITKPIQLLGAWLAGLFSIDAAFLLAATRMPDGSWEASALTVAAIVNVPVFLIAVFVLQTRFRPELQEDSYYSSYLSSKTNQTITVKKDEVQILALVQRINEIEDKIPSFSCAQENASPDIASLTFGINKFFSDKTELAAKLAAYGVLGYTEFGGDEPPKNRNASISKHLPVGTVQFLIKLAKELGFRTYNLYDNIEEDAVEDMLLGSYGPGGMTIT